MEKHTNHFSEFLPSNVGKGHKGVSFSEEVDKADKE